MDGTTGSGLQETEAGVPATWEARGTADFPPQAFIACGCAGRSGKSHEDAPRLLTAERDGPALQKPLLGSQR